MSMQMTSSSEITTGLFDCNNLSCIDVYGADTITFLQSQLTQDLALLRQGRSALAGYCSAQGRLLATMLLCPSEQADRVHVILRSDLVEGLLKRLRMFVLRSKVTLELQPQRKVFGLITSNTDPLASKMPESIWGAQHLGPQLWVRAPSSESNFARSWIICDGDAMPNITSPSRHEQATVWEIADILAGIPWIQESTRDLFIPQSVNLDLIDGVSFTKGCYPGQEVVARAHYRSKVKRRMHAATVTPANSHIQASADVHPAASPDDPCGRIIQVTHTASASFVLFEAPDRQIAEGPLGVASIQDANLTLLDLPYSTTVAE